MTNVYEQPGSTLMHNTALEMEFSSLDICRRNAFQNQDPTRNP